MNNQFKSIRVITLSIIALSGAVLSCTDTLEIEAELNSIVDDKELVDSSMLNTKVATSNSVCTTAGTNTTREYTFTGDVNSSINTKIDDRTCTYNYTQLTENGIIKGVYKIKANSNHMDDLQPRIERASPVVSNVKNGNYVSFSGYITINRAGHVAGQNISTTSVKNQSGTYIIQAKGKHSGGGGSKDPAICLLRAVPRFTGNTQSSFDIYREEITTRGGIGLSGRQLIFLKNIPANVRTKITLKTGFELKGVAPNEFLNHYVNITIGTSTYNWDVPEPSKALQAKYRFGAYRVKGGEAEIKWDNVTREFVNTP
ncbi:hypothetical protein JAO71_14955 [Olleya sp. YSTF-M6]|uniref:PL28 ulvan lyase domain-containing protein n=1 Tax=Olleya sediminilitoris TaxID=2795739 RepID=A0ABS1WPQ8_9FLAO|nr:hypothetical protein [Olleya sediminilitoris]MBL7561100.1 hypothetical protein [Olleya sediminilitoris]